MDVYSAIGVSFFAGMHNDAIAVYWLRGGAVLGAWGLRD